MSITFAQLLTDCSVALGDISGTCWSRSDVIIPWCLEAMRTFPFGRPMLLTHLVSAGEVHTFDLPEDYRELVSVEYPIDEIPPSYLIRRSHFDPEFWQSDVYYDVDHNYEDGVGWIIYFSSELIDATSVKVEYLACHDLDMADDEQHFITVPDEFYSLLIAQVTCRAYRERLGHFMQDPTVHTSIVMQLTEMVRRSEENYHKMLDTAQQKLASSKLSPRQTMDGYDRVY